ncbi:DUF2807 domain-containing protein [Polaribacter haliotis]|uniref:DUF2807 domain-containing protein n=1 Tax=Polaribacter haliotis TaxID=1888915 RepID=A0A7L8ACS9_9FLAO|nr:head GIN domain-containing protein [Polaribacter haliotis]QOD59805.1 DUF2807 domain-containing protein [Polaribacter haliotis]
MKNLAFLNLLFVSFLINAQTTVTKNLGDYNTLKVYNGIEVTLIKSSNQKLEITGEKSEMVKIKNVDNTLKLSLPFSLKPEDNSADGKILIKIYYNKNIDIIDGNEGATITGKDFNQDKIEVNAQERAFINLTITTKELKVRSSSGGIIKLSGTTTNQEVDVDLYGIYHGFNMKSTEKTDVKAGTGAKAEVNSEKTLNAKVSFGGTIFYRGNPEVVKDKKVIGGIIEKRN